MLHNTFVAVLALVMTASAFGGTISLFEGQSNADQEILVA